MNISIYFIILLFFIFILIIYFFNKNNNKNDNVISTKYSIKKYIKPDNEIDSELNYENFKYDYNLKKIITNKIFSDINAPSSILNNPINIQYGGGSKIIAKEKTLLNSIKDGTKINQSIKNPLMPFETGFLYF